MQSIHKILLILKLTNYQKKKNIDQETSFGKTYHIVIASLLTDRLSKTKIGALFQIHIQEKNSSRLKFFFNNNDVKISYSCTILINLILAR